MGMHPSAQRVPDGPKGVNPHRRVLLAPVLDCESLNSSWRRTTTSGGHVSAFTCFTLGVAAVIVHRTFLGIGQTPSPTLALAAPSVQF